jgi:hypothetical protein
MPSTRRSVVGQYDQHPHAYQRLACMGAVGSRLGQERELELVHR